MDELSKQAAQDRTGLAPVYVDVPDKSGMPGAGTSRLLNTGLTEAEATVAAEPAPVLHPSRKQERRTTVVRATWILGCITAGVMLGLYKDAVQDRDAGQAGWVLTALAVLVPCLLVLGAYPTWKRRKFLKDYKQRHQAWVARFIGNWPLRERLTDVDAIADVWQRVSTRTMADTLEAGRDTILAQGSPGDRPARLLAEALAAVDAWARAPWPDPALYRAAQDAVDRFGELAGRRRADAVPPAPPPNFP
ncbi:hypothetical protein AB0280_05345 [Pseudarthrobacter sp902506025]|uniref:Uncharacterized protein n=1 Tax=Pseudarthrobacter defluvii TaxID=410837 RepID=A0ABT9ULH2_9MICC|nr:hypothetical protein [Pseudarthrobacter defluvii]MDQ0119798.1 hypothetical protein [Pseudarthrobacter defluvii]